LKQSGGKRVIKNQVRSRKTGYHLCTSRCSAIRRQTSVTAFSGIHHWLFVRISLYRKWHRTPGRHAIHWGSFSVTAITAFALLFQTFFSPLAAFAGSTSWTFGTSVDYSYNATTAEVVSSSVRLKSQQYTGAEANTAAYWNLDQTSGNSISDNGPSANTATVSTTSPCAGATWSAGKVVTVGADRNSYGATTLAGNAGCVTAADSPSLSLNSQVTLEAYAKFTGAFDATNTVTQGVLDKGNYRMYFDEGDGKLKFELDDSATKTWSKVGGSSLTPTTPGINGNDGLNGSWRQAIPHTIYAIQEFNSELYVGTYGTGTDLGTGEVWKYSGSNQTWTKVGGDGNGSTNWDTKSSEGVFSMAVYNSALYAGLGLGAGDAEVWRYSGSGTTWTKVAGGGVNSSWTTANAIEFVGSLVSDGSYLYAGTGSTSASFAASDADVWRYNGTSWTQIGGTSAAGANVNSSWGAWVATTNAFETVRSMVVMGSSLYVGLGDTANGTTYADGEIWRCDSCGTSPTWTKVGGDGTGWAANLNELVFSLATDGTTLYAGLGSSASDADVWACTLCGTLPVWTQIGGNEVQATKPNWNTNYEHVRGLTVLNSKLYASLGDTAGEAEVWRYDTTSWTKVAGDGVNSTWDASFTTPASTTNTKEYAFLGTFGTSLVAGTGATPQDAEVWTCSSCDTAPSWSWVGGRDFRSWGSYQPSYVTSMAVNAGNLYVGTGTTNKHAAIWEYNGSTWTQVGGGNLNISSGSWENYEYVLSMTSFRGDLYAGFGSTADDADVWKYNSGAWTQVGGTTAAGATVNNGWTDANNIEEVASMVADDTYLYAGTGNTATDGDVWRFDGTTWGTNPIGGTRNDTNVMVNSSWATNTYERVQSMKIANGLLFAGLGASAGDAEVWRWNGTTWGGATIGGDGVGTGASWNAAGDVVRESVRSMTFIGATMYVGLGDTNDGGANADAEVWSCSNCLTIGATPAWTKIGGDGVPGTWDNSTYEQVTSISSYKGHLFATLGTNNSGTDYDSEIWEYDGSTWSKVGGDGATADTWGGNYEIAGELITLNGKLYVGLGTTNNNGSASDAEVWEYGANTVHVIASTTTSWTAGRWYHIAGTYDGTTAKVYVCDSTTLSNCDTAQTTASWGTVTLADNTLPLSIGSLWGSLGPDRTLGGFAGQLDEVRVMNTAQTSFALTQFSPTGQTAQPVAAVSRAGVLSWDKLTVTETANGGGVTYRFSDDGGTTWKYKSSGNWVTSSGTSQANAAVVSGPDLIVDLATFPVTSSGLLWQAILTGNGDQQVTLNTVVVSWADDTIDPANPSSLSSAKNASGGTVDLTSDTWYNYANPSFTWSAGTDGGSGVEGYYVYFGTSSTADPTATSGIINSGGAVQFQAGTTLNVTGTISNGNTYYLLVKTRDAAQNVSDTAQNLFTYKYDNLAPTAPTIISVSPSGYTSRNNFTFLWPTSGSSVAVDVGAPTTGSGLAGYQYKTGATSGSLSDWSSVSSNATVTLDAGAYQEGVNTFELRVVDVAGNSSNTVSASYYFAGNAPSGPRNLSVTPASSAAEPKTDNAFGFNWDEPEIFNGSIKRYHFSINKLPTNTNTSTTTSRQISAGPYATQQGKNTFYVIAEDEAGNISYNTYASVDFYTITPAPEAPSAVQIFDISNRDTEEFALSMKWTEPAVKPSGFDGYEVFRSADGVTFESAGTTKSPVFVDTNLESKQYAYNVKSMDNASQFSAASTTVQLTPTGRYTTAPKLLDGPTATPKSFSANVTWQTDRIGSSFIEVGEDIEHLGKEKGGDTVGSLDLSTKHSVDLLGLEPETAYTYRAIWVDQDGNRGQSDTLTFKTGLRPKISDVKISNVTLTNASVSWTSTTVATSKIVYGKNRAYNLSVEDSSGSQTTRHSIRLDALDHSSTYSLIINGSDTDGNFLTSDEYTFTTLTKPSLKDVRFEPVKDTASTTMRFTWSTNVPTTSTIQYTAAGASAQTKSSPEYVTSHELTVDHLEEKAPYTFTVRGVDQFGNSVVSDQTSFTSPDDSRPPKVTNMTIEVRSNGAGQTQKAQLIVSWDTDEPSTSQIEYGPGISSDSYPLKTQEDSAASISHVVIVTELEPAKLYHLRAVSRDRAGNAGTSSDTTAITGKVQRSVVDIIISTLQRSLGFLGNVPGAR